MFCNVLKLECFALVITLCLSLQRGSQRITVKRVVPLPGLFSLCFSVVVGITVSQESCCSGSQDNKVWPYWYQQMCQNVYLYAVTVMPSSSWDGQSSPVIGVWISLLLVQ